MVARGSRPRLQQTRYLVIFLWIGLRDAILFKSSMLIVQGPSNTRNKGKWRVKLTVLYACSLCRAFYLDLVSSLETQEFTLSLTKFIARKGRPDEIYSYNGSTFVGVGGWSRKTMSDEKFSKFLAQNKIIWQFNLSHTPWWGGQLGIIGLLKSHRAWPTFMARAGRSTTRC